MIRRAVGGAGIGGGVHVPVAADVDLPRDGVRPARVRDGASEKRLVVRILHLVERLRRLEDEVRLRADGLGRRIVGVASGQELPLHVEGIARLVRDGNVERGGVAEVEEEDRVRVGGREGVDHGRTVRVADDGEAVEVSGDAHVVRAGADGELDVAGLVQRAGEERAAGEGVGILVVAQLQAGGKAVGLEDDVRLRDAVGLPADGDVVGINAVVDPHANHAFVRGDEGVAVLPVGVADSAVALERHAVGERAVLGKRLEAERHLVRDACVDVGLDIDRVPPERRDSRVVGEIVGPDIEVVDAGVLEEQEPLRAGVDLVVGLAAERERERQVVCDVAGVFAAFPEGHLVRRDLVGARGGRPGGMVLVPFVVGLVATLDEESLPVGYALHAVRQRSRRDGEAVPSRRKDRARRDQQRKRRASRGLRNSGKRGN